MIHQLYAYDDFRLFALSQFHSMATLCTLTSETLIDVLELLTLKILISRQAQFRETSEHSKNYTYQWKPQKKRFASILLLEGFFDCKWVPEAFQTFCWASFHTCIF